MKPAGRAIAAAIAVCAATPRAARAVGLDGPESAEQRFGAALGTGFDAVEGFGADRFAFVEAAVHGERRWRGWLVLGGTLTVRQDVRDYDFALGSTRPRRTRGLALQAFVGYDGPAFHISAGPWLYGDGRYDDRFRAGWAAWGVVRIRVGHLDRWHGSFSVLDGAPYTAAGAGTAARLLLGLPPVADGRHRVVVGPYFTIGETIRGLYAADEWDLRATHARAPRALRLGGNLGMGPSGWARWEWMTFVGCVW